VFTARYGLIPYIKQITFRLQEVKGVFRYNIQTFETVGGHDYADWVVYCPFPDIVDYNPNITNTVETAAVVTGPVFV
jgi:predicted ATP-grasp superfamily ATP-dependent carboligase